MKSITKILLLLAVALGMVTSWSYSVYALPEFDFESDESDGGAGLRAVIEGCYEMVDGELVEVEELEVDKAYFISATLKNVAELKYWNPEPDLKYNDELYGIWFQFKLPTVIGHDTPGQVILESSACRRNYDDRWNKSEATIEVYAKDGQTLALEFAPGYCGIDTLHQINDYCYYLRSEEEYTFVHGDHDSEHPIASGSKRSILLAVRTRDSQEFAEKRALERVNHLRTGFMSNGLMPARSNVIDRKSVV